MSALVDHDPALRLWRAETRWLDQCAARLRLVRTRRRPETRSAPKVATR